MPLTVSRVALVWRIEPFVMSVVFGVCKELCGVVGESSCFSLKRMKTKRNYVILLRTLHSLRYIKCIDILHWTVY